MNLITEVPFSMSVVMIRIFGYLQICYRLKWFLRKIRKHKI